MSRIGDGGGTSAALDVARSGNDVGSCPPSAALSSWSPFHVRGATVVGRRITRVGGVAADDEWAAVAEGTAWARVDCAASSLQRPPDSRAVTLQSPTPAFSPRSGSSSGPGSPNAPPCHGDAFMPAAICAPSAAPNGSCAVEFSAKARVLESNPTSWPICANTHMNTHSGGARQAMWCCSSGSQRQANLHRLRAMHKSRTNRACQGWEL